MKAVTIFATSKEIASTLERMFDVTAATDHSNALETGSLPRTIGKDSIVVISDAKADQEKMGLLVTRAKQVSAKVVIVEHARGTDLPRGCFADATLPSGVSFGEVRALLQQLNKK